MLVIYEKQEQSTNFGYLYVKRVTNKVDRVTI
jgi:hypothetical protein